MNAMIVESPRQWTRLVALASGGAPKALHLGLLVMVAVAVGAVAVGFRSAKGARALRQRVAVAMVPTETFNPSVEEISRFAAQLTRIRSSPRTLTDRSVSAVRIRLVSASGGRMAYLVEGPEWSRSVIRLSGYSEVELRDPETVLGVGGRPVSSRSGQNGVAVPSAGLPEESESDDENEDDGEGER